MFGDRSYDGFFLGISAVLLICGLFVLTSASLGISTSRFGYPYYYFFHQVIFGLLPGLILMYWASRVNYLFWKRHALLILFIAVFLMFLVFVPKIGIYHGGAKRWIGWGSVSFQPAEFLKFAYIIYLAAWLESKSKSIKSFKFGFLPFLVMSAFILPFLILQPDIGTLAVLIFSIGALFFLSGGNIKQMTILGLLCVIVVGLLIFFEPYRFSRLTTFLDPKNDPQGAGYQINQALIAVGSGGLFGKGFGLSLQKFNLLPEPVGDSIFAILSEELGFIGGAILVLLFLIFFLRGMKIVKNAPDLFARFLSAGFLFLIIFQAFINISAIIGLIPLTGIPLPFVSYGGSALMITLAELGIILNISKARQKRL